MQKPLDKLAEIQTRLDASSSDPKWLNEGLAELKTLIIEAEPPAPPLPAMFHVDFQAMASMSAMQALMGRVEPLTGEATEEEIAAKKKEISELAMLATYTGTEMNNRRIVRMQQQAAARKAAEEAAQAAVDEAAAETES